MNKTAKQRLSQAEIDSLVQQAATKKQLGSGPGLPASRASKQEAKPSTEPKRQPAAAAPATEAVADKPEGQRQPAAKIQEQPRVQQPQAVPAKKEELPSTAEAEETPARAENNDSQSEKASPVVVVASPVQHSPLELKQYFWLGGEGTSDLQPDRVMTVLNKKLFKLG